MLALKPASSLIDFYASGLAAILGGFYNRGEGRTALVASSDLMDAVVTRLYREFVSSELGEVKNFCLVALGGFGRRELFPCSDIDLLFLSENSRTQTSRRESAAAISRSLWDLRIRTGHTMRTLAECGRLYRDNLEFSVSLLDCRYLAGDVGLFATLRQEIIPHLVARDRQDLVRNLVELTRRRHEKHGNTIFHLEPNLKDVPGGLRDYHVARWLVLISELAKHGRWVTPEALWPAALQAASGCAFTFLCAARCFLHFRRERDDNQLTYELQEQAAALGIGHRPGEALAAAEWMRDYFRHARSVDRITTALLEETAPARSSLYAAFQDWRSRLSNADFSVLRGRIFLRQPAAVFADPSLLLRLFEFMARHRLELSRETERCIEEAQPRLPRQPDGLPRIPDLWRHFQQILVLPHAAEALRAMHRLGLLDTLFPEFRAIDSLVIRDFYHRYTVDEHSFMAIQNLHSLRPSRTGTASASSWGSGAEGAQKFAEILSELEQPELVFLALLFHDVGKGMPATNHIQGSLEAIGRILSRLELEPEQGETVRFLILNHQEMSETLQRRDIFDPETIRALADKIGRLERLKMLCLLTYADIKSVNPEALTPWKAEMLWQLYAATSNYLTRSLDEERLRASAREPAGTNPILALLPAGATEGGLHAFLEGFPRRYLEIHPPEEIAAHLQMAGQVRENPVQVQLRSRRHFHELTVLTGDRPFLFASITGTLAAWGMNIVKADAFANKQGIVLDTFLFVDLYRTLELNPSEVDRFRQCLGEVLTGKGNLRDLLSRRVSSQSQPPIKVKIPTLIRFDDRSSSHSTLLELITQDRPGLLYQVSSTLAELGCNIEVALIDTEGQKVIDVFYLTSGGAKLGQVQQQEIRRALIAQLQDVPRS